jgi:hypothetical protein
MRGYSHPCTDAIPTHRPSLRRDFSACSRAPVDVRQLPIYRGEVLSDLREFVDAWFSTAEAEAALDMHALRRDEPADRN